MLLLARSVPEVVGALLSAGLLGPHVSPILKNLPVLMAIDYGTKSTGIAVSTRLWTQDLALSCCVTRAPSRPTTDYHKDLADVIAGLAMTSTAKVIAIGDPLRKDGSSRIDSHSRQQMLSGEGVSSVHSFVAVLREVLGKKAGSVVALVMMDERFSTAEARGTFRGAPTKSQLDQRAAGIILQGLIDRAKAELGRAR